MRKLTETEITELSERVFDNSRIRRCAEMKLDIYCQESKYYFRTKESQDFIYINLIFPEDPIEDMIDKIFVSLKRDYVEGALEFIYKNKYRNK